MSDASSSAIMQHEREEVVCRRCGLVYQQQTTGYTDELLHAACPRCQLVHSLSE